MSYNLKFQIEFQPEISFHSVMIREKGKTENEIFKQEKRTFFIDMNC